MAEASLIGVDPFRRLRDAAKLPGEGVAWVEGLRRAAFDDFAAKGLPTNKVETWKYTSLRPLARLPLVPANSEAAPGDIPAPLADDAVRAVFVNGRFAPALSHDLDSQPGLRIRSLAAALAEGDATLEPLLAPSADRDPVAALNLALMTDGAVIEVDEAATPARPLELLFLTVGGKDAPVSVPRTLVRLGRGARLTVVERCEGTGAYYVNAGLTIDLAEDALLTHLKLQDESGESWHTAATRADVAARATYESFVLTLGARLARNTIDVRLTGIAAHCRLDGAYALRGRQHADHTSRIDHMVADCTSRQVYKGVLDEASRGVFQGHIVVHEDAQKTDGHQLNRALLLSREAEIDSKPMLEIYADDVKCSHGATIGDLDENALFYLRSRGIPEAAARAMLVDAFLAEPIEAIAHEGLRAAMAARLARWLAGGAA